LKVKKYPESENYQALAVSDQIELKQYSPEDDMVSEKRAGIPVFCKPLANLSTISIGRAAIMIAHVNEARPRRSWSLLASSAGV